MDGFIALIVIAVGIAVFVSMVRKSRRDAQAVRDIDAQRAPTPAARPAPRRTPDQSAKPSRAMRTGWSRGTVTFTYEDAAGDVTCRTVTVHSATATHLKGECQDRQAERTFRIDRIIGDVVDVETGEVVRPRSLARHFA
jgi:predicted DNA-binding transcriptional regulator YafY